MKDCAIKCIDAATNECPESCGPIVPHYHLPLPCHSAGTAWEPSCIVLQIDFVARLQDRQRQRRQRRLAKRGQQFAKQHCAYTTTTKLFGICAFFLLLVLPLIYWPVCIEFDCISNYKLHSPERNVQLKGI